MSSKSRASSQQVDLPMRSEPKSNSKLVFQLKAELNRLQQRDREWKTMFQMLSHDLKEPLVTLEGFTKLLSDPQVSSKDRKRYEGIIREAVGSLHHLVGSLQSIAKLYQEPSQLTDVSLFQLLDSVETSLSDQLRKSKGKILRPKSDLLIHGDPVRLYQIFLNLISNALKYRKPDEPPVIQLRHRKDVKHIRILVEDNGVGMSKKDMEKVFSPFTRVSAEGKEGLGIGLSIVKRIAESFGGKILVRSRLGKGTTFSLCLPREKPNQ